MDLALQRDAEHRESLSTTMRALRHDNLKHTNEIASLEEKNAEAQRKLNIAESSEACLRTQLKSADATIRGIKDELARTRVFVAQARASCTAEVRRKDLQLDALKKQLGEAGRARGSRSNPAITMITVSADVGVEREASCGVGGDTAADDYSLRNETNAFLAKLAQSLSEENEALQQAMRQATEQLRDMSGWDGSESGDSLVTKPLSWEDLSTEMSLVLDHMRNILTNPSFVPIEEVEVREEEIHRLRDGWIKMEKGWKEAMHLIDGWRKRMAANGRPICEEELRMGLRLSPIRIKDIKETEDPCAFEMTNEHLAEEEPAPEPDVDHGSAESDEDEDLESGEVPNIEILQESGTCHGQSDSSADSSPLPEPPQLSPLRSSASAANRGAGRSVNLRTKAPWKPVDFTTIVEENTWDLLVEDQAPAPSTSGRPLAGAGASLLDRPPLEAEKAPKRPRSPSRTSLEDALLGQRKTVPHDRRKGGDDDDGISRPGRGGTACAPPNPSKPSSTRQPSPRRGGGGASRLPLPRSSADTALQQTPLTMASIAAKLAASEREADAARVRAKLKAARGCVGGGGTKKQTAVRVAPAADEPQLQQEPEPEHEREAEESEAKTVAAPRSDDCTDGKMGCRDVDPMRHDHDTSAAPLGVEKRRLDRRSSKAASRRRSTLSPWELQSLISGTAQ